MRELQNCVGRCENIPAIGAQPCLHYVTIGMLYQKDAANSVDEQLVGGNRYRLLRLRGEIGSIRQSLIGWVDDSPAKEIGLRMLVPHDFQ
jgi:hypothetical protein